MEVFGLLIFNGLFDNVLSQYLGSTWPHLQQEEDENNKNNTMK